MTRIQRFLLAALITAFASVLQAQSKPFLYQGRLEEAGQSPTGHYGFRFRLLNAQQQSVGNTIESRDVSVVGGLFQVELDFGPGVVFDGSVRFLEVAVRLGTSTGDYTLLGPPSGSCPCPRPATPTRPPR